jgi:hypothetical protein
VRPGGFLDAAAKILQETLEFFLLVDLCGVVSRPVLLVGLPRGASAFRELERRFVVQGRLGRILGCRGGFPSLRELDGENVLAWQLPLGEVVAIAFQSPLDHTDDVFLLSRLRWNNPAIFATLDTDDPGNGGDGQATLAADLGRIG